MSPIATTLARDGDGSYIIRKEGTESFSTMDDRDDTSIFEAALKVLAQRGGGRLTVAGPSVYRIRPINLTSHLEFRLQAGVTLEAINDATVWPILPALPSYGQGRDHPGPRYTSLIHGEHLINVTMAGAGMTTILDGKGQYWWDRRRNHTEGNITRGHLIEFMYSSNILLKDLQLRDPAFWTNHIYDCDNVTISGMHIRNDPHSPNTDGWDPDSSRNVLIEDCTYEGGDDCVAIKSGWDCFGLDYGKPACNITIRNLTCDGKFASIALGSEMSGGIDGVLIENVRFARSNRPFNLKVGNTRGGYIRNVMVRNITVDGPVQEVIHMDMYHYNDSPNPSCSSDYKPHTLSQISNVVLQNFWATPRAEVIGHATFHFRGDPRQPMENIFLDNLSFGPPTSRNATAWLCSGVHGFITNGTITPWPPCDAFEIMPGYGLHTEVKQRQVVNSVWHSDGAAFFEFAWVSLFLFSTFRLTNKYIFSSGLLSRLSYDGDPPVRS